VGISGFVLQHFMKDHKGVQPRQHILYYGIGMERFGQVVDTEAVRSDLHIPDASKMLLYIGRINKEKNPIFILDVLNKLRARGTDAYAVFVGEGEMNGALREKANALGLTGYVRFLGWSDRVVALMKTASVFLFPRLLEPKEGLGLVVVESQCAGLPMITTDGIVDDPIVIPQLITRKELVIDTWVDETERVLQSDSRISSAEALKQMNDSPFNLPLATHCLISLYETVI
jgi:glycosyltransferase involved in cell wall biosynthesis